MKSSVLYTKLSFRHVVVFTIPSPDRVFFLAYPVRLRRRSEDSFSEDSYKAVWAFLFQAAGSCPRTHPGISPRTGACVQLCAGEGAEIATAAQVKDARTFAQRKRVGGDLRLRRSSWCNLWNCDGLGTLMKMISERTGNHRNKNGSMGYSSYKAYCII